MLMRKLKSFPVFIVSILILFLLAGASLLIEDSEFSELENRPLVSLRPLTKETVISGSWMRQAEEYTSDQFPFRDIFVKLNLLKEQILMRTEHRDVVLGKNGRMFGRNDRLPERLAVESNMAALKTLVRKTGLPLELMIIPSSSLIYRHELPAFYPLLENELSTIAESARRHGIRFIDTEESLNRTSQTSQTHYKTDHHLTWSGAEAVIRKILSLWQKDFVEPGNIVSLDGFYGSYYTRAPYPFVRREFLTYGEYHNLRLYIDGMPEESLIDEELIMTNNKYAALLHNNPGQLCLVNDHVDQGVLLVIRDSNANVILPSLAQHFHRVEALDLRFFSGNLIEFIERKEAQQILCIFGSDVFQTDRNLALQTVGL